MDSRRIAGLKMMQHDNRLSWLDAHADFAKLCVRGGWPDGATLRRDVRSKKDREWIADNYSGL